MRMGHGQLLDSMVHDGLWDPYKNVHMGNCAELCAAKYAFTREAQDAFALESYQRALRSAQSLIYLENQFLWAPQVVEILLDETSTAAFSSGTMDEESARAAMIAGLAVGRREGKAHAADLAVHAI